MEEGGREGGAESGRSYPGQAHTQRGSSKGRVSCGHSHTSQLQQSIWLLLSNYLLQGLPFSLCSRQPQPPPLGNTVELKGEPQKGELNWGQLGSLTQQNTHLLSLIFSLLLCLIARKVTKGPFHASLSNRLCPWKHGKGLGNRITPVKLSF